MRHVRFLSLFLSFFPVVVCLRCWNINMIVLISLQCELQINNSTEFMRNIEGLCALERCNTELDERKHIFFSSRQDIFFYRSRRNWIFYFQFLALNDIKVHLIHNVA